VCSRPPVIIVTAFAGYAGQPQSEGLIQHPFRAEFFFPPPALLMGASLGDHSLGWFSNSELAAIAMRSGPFTPKYRTPYLSPFLMIRILTRPLVLIPVRRPGILGIEYGSGTTTGVRVEAPGSYHRLGFFFHFLFFFHPFPLLDLAPIAA